MSYKFAIVPVVCALIGCGGTDVSDLAEASADANLPQPIRSFLQLCIPNLDNPTAIIAAGAEAGFDMTDLGENKAFGTRKSTDETLQINAFTRNAFECAVTTPGQPDGAEWTGLLFASLGVEPNGTAGTLRFDRKDYTVYHDRNGGENFVVFRRR